MPSGRTTASARKKKAEATDKTKKKKSPSSSSSSYSSSSSSSKKQSLPVKDEEADKEIELDPALFTQRPGDQDKSTSLKGSRLKKETFRKHFRKTLGKRKERVCWTPSEMDALSRGHDQHGRKWTQILSEYRAEFNECRTSVDLKDKFNNMQKKTGTTSSKSSRSSKSQKKQKVQEDAASDVEDDEPVEEEEEEEEEEAEEEEEEEEDEASEPSFDGDVRLRILFGTKGETHKLLGAGHHTYQDIIDGARDSFGIKTHKGEISVSAGMIKNEYETVDLSDQVGALVPLPHGSEQEKPTVWIEIRQKISGDI